MGPYTLVVWQEFPTRFLGGHGHLLEHTLEVFGRIVEGLEKDGCLVGFKSMLGPTASGSA